MSLLPGTEVAARGLRWEVVFSQAVGEQELLRLRCLEGYLRGEEMDLLVPFETVEPIAREMAPERAARLANWRVYHQAFLLEQALGPDALGRVYEALLELEPGIATAAMCRLRRQKLEVVVPEAQGEPYRENVASQAEAGDEEPEEEDEAEETPKRGKKTKVQWIEAITAGRFFLRVGLGRKASGSYYTPHPFVRFLVQETLGPQVAERSPATEPDPGAILELKVLDPAMGSGHFLVEACRFLGDQLYEACRLCDEQALIEDEQAGRARTDADRERHLARAAELRRRVEDLPDPQDELVAYLPSRVPEGEESGLSLRKALAIARRLVAVHCLYGVDKNPLAVELAKLSLWLESYAEGLPLTFLDHRLICGDSLTGPFFEHLLTYPGSGEKIEGLFVQGLTDRLTSTLGEALAHVRDLEASVGTDVADLERKRGAKRRLDEALAPFKTLAAAWGGGVMLGGEACDDTGYETLLRAVAEKGDAVAVVEGRASLARMVETGKEGVAYELAFPEVFYPEGRIRARSGFEAVVGNPPWDTIQFKSKEFFAAFDMSILEAPTKKERGAIERRLLDDSEVASLFREHVEGFERVKRVNDRLYAFQKIQVEGDLAGRFLDAFRVFMERNAQLLRGRGFVGVLVPSAFHANEGATGVRQLYLDYLSLKKCFSFENKNKLFEIHRSFKFATVVARREQGGTGEFECAFYLHDMEWLFQQKEPLRYSMDFVRRTGGEYLSLIEVRSPEDLDITLTCYQHAQPLKERLSQLGITVGQQLNTTLHHELLTSASTVPLAQRGDVRNPAVMKEVLAFGLLVLQEGKTFRQYCDTWGDAPRYFVVLQQLAATKPSWLRGARHYRCAFRRIAGPGDENVSIWVLLPPGCITTDTSPSEMGPWQRATSKALALVGLLNSFPVDWLLQLRVRAHVDQFILDRTPVPPLVGSWSCLVHSALRLTCNHAGYAPLWREQVGDTWREPRPLHTWPALDGDDARWAVRAAIDAVVADAYGLSREQYAHVLSSFSHRSYPRAPELCLAAFDELKTIGLDAFTRKHDPYWDIPLNEGLPEPVIDLPIPTEGQVIPIEGRRKPKSRKVATDQLAFGLDAPAAVPRAAQPPPPPYQAARAENGEAFDTILSLLTGQQVITSQEAQDATGLSAAEVRPLLQRLVDEGHAVREGKARGTRYRRSGGGE
jgi:hypothetical protein